jgi:hypothetical protein
VKVHLRLLEQKGLEVGSLQNIDQDGKSLAHPVAHVDEIECPLAALHSDLKWVALCSAFVDDFNPFKEVRFGYKFSQSRLQSSPLLLLG